ncbi:MAG: NADH-quinone oxidoreductase subunit C [Bryobacteraceae bacterium]|jgi:NADH-quinone oxidoreductase subunit C
MADEQQPEGAGTPPPAKGEADKPPAPAAKPVPPKPAAPPPKPPAVMAAVPWESDLARAVKERFDDGIKAASTYAGQNFIVTAPDAAVPLLEYLKLEADFDYLVDITAVDWPKRPDRFDLVYIVYSFSRNERVRIKTAIPDGFKPATAVDVHLTANWLEREVFDMFGIEFAGHPDLRRILMPEDWQGYPLRKDYSILQQDERWVRENLGIESGQ